MTALGLLKKISLFIWVLHRKFFVSLVVFLAMLLLVLHGTAYYIEKNPDLVRSVVATHLDTKIEFDEIKVDVHLLYPSVSMKNFSIINKVKEENVLDFESASMRLNIPASILSRHLVIDTLSLEGFNVFVHRSKKGDIYIADFQLTDVEKKIPASSSNVSSYYPFLNQTNFMLSKGEIYFVDEMEVIPSIQISAINLKMKNNNERHQVSLLARLNESATYLDVRFDFNGDINRLSNWDGKVYAAIDNLNQQALLHFLNKDVLQVEEFQLNNVKANTKIWSTIIKGKLQSIHGELAIENAYLSRIDNNNRINIDTLATNFKLERNYSKVNETISNEIDWMLDLYDLSLSVDAKKLTEKYMHLNFQKADHKELSKVHIFLDKLNINEFHHVVSFFSPKDFSQKIYSLLKPEGRLENIMTSLEFNASQMPVDIQHYQVQLDINNFGINAMQSMPKIRNLSAQLIFNETIGRAFINSRDIKLYPKSLFRDSWTFKQLNGELFWQKEGEQWLLGAEKIQIDSNDFTANADVKFWISKEGQSFMDLRAFYENVNVEAISNYLPAKVMNEGLVKWLDYSLISGLVPDGGIVFRGELDQFPYEEHNGNMDIVFNTQNVLLEYTKGWPMLTDIDAQVQFTQKGMFIEGRHSKLFSAESNNVQVDLEDYLVRLLLIKGDIKANIDDGLKFLRQSEMVSNDVANIIDAKGDIDINLDLKIPLEKGQLDNKVRIKVKDADYFPPGFDRKKGLVSHLKGKVMVHNTAINSNKLTADIMGLPAKILIKTDKRASSSKKDPNVSVNIDSEISIEKLKQFNLISEMVLPLADKLSGTSNIKLNIDLPNSNRALAFNIYTSLRNIRSDLPAPFTKQAKQMSPFVMSFAEVKNSERKNTSALLKMKFSKVLSLAFLLDTSSNDKAFKLLKGNIAFEGDKAKLPDINILKVTGALKQVPFEQWQSVFDSSKNSHKKVSKQNSSQDSRVEPLSIPIEIAMIEIIFPEFKPDNNTSDASKKSSKKMDESGFEPEKFPLLNGYINSFKVGNINLGRMKIKTSRVEKSIVFDQLSLKGDYFSFSGQGKWHHWNEVPEVDLEGKAEIPSLDKLASAFGYDQLIRQGKTEVSGYISWSGGLNDLSKENLEGKLNFSVDKGAWVEVKPGAAGRLLGLFNMNAFARRLSLDFSDVSKEGFEFDKIEGDFRFKDATAHTDNLRIYAPSARILVRGSTGLVSQHIDQQVTVIPEVSATLPLAGAAVAGPAGAAVVWVGQRILGDQLNQVTAYDYTIKGNWDKPEIKKDKTSGNTLNQIKNIFSVKEDKPGKFNGSGNNPIFENNVSE